MGWLRSGQRFVAYLAVLALTMQFVASFGHIHAEDFRPWPGASPSDVASLALSPIATPDSLVPASSSVHASDDQRGLPHSKCAVCVSIGLLSQALNGQLPVLSTPTAVPVASVRPSNNLQFCVVRYYPFRTRAPPVV
jgi:hypothetical protein